MKSNKINENYLIPSIIFILGMFTFLACEMEIGSDLARYMNHALLPLKKIILFKRGLFYLILKVSFNIFGASPLTAAYTIRFFAVLNPVLLYFIGKQMFDKKIGLIASLLILSNYAVNQRTSLTIDTIVCFLMLLSILFIYKFFETRNVIFFLGSILCLIMGFFIKEIALILILSMVLLLFFIKEYRIKKNFIIFSVFLFIGGSLGGLLLSTGHLITADLLNNFQELQKGMFINNPDSNIFVNFFLNVKLFLSHIFSYFYGDSDSIFHQFTIAPLIYIAWIYICFLALKKNKKAGILSLIFLSFIPLFIFFGCYNMRLSNGLFFIFISFLTLAVFLLKVSELLKKAIFKKRILPFNNNIVTIFMVVLIILIQSVVPNGLNDKGNLKFLQTSVAFKLFSKGKIEWSLGSLFSKDHERIVSWISENMPSSKGIMTTWYSTHHALNIYNGGGHKFYFLGEGTIFSSYSNKSAGRISKLNVLYVTTKLRSKAQHSDIKNQILYLTEFRFLLNSKSAHYVLTSKNDGLDYYVEHNPAYMLVKDFTEEGMRLYKISRRRLKLLNYKVPTVVSRGFMAYLSVLHKKYPRKYKIAVHRFTKNFGWTGKDIKAMLQFKNNPIKAENYIKSSNKFILKSEVLSLLKDLKDLNKNLQGKKHKIVSYPFPFNSVGNLLNLDYYKLTTESAFLHINHSNFSDLKILGLDWEFFKENQCLYFIKSKNIGDIPEHTKMIYDEDKLLRSTLLDISKGNKKVKVRIKDQDRLISNQIKQALKILDPGQLKLLKKYDFLLIKRDDFDFSRRLELANELGVTYSNDNFILYSLKNGKPLINEFQQLPSIEVQGKRGEFKIEKSKNEKGSIVTVSNINSDKKGRRMLQLGFGFNKQDLEIDVPEKLYIHFIAELEIPEKIINQYNYMFIQDYVADGKKNKWVRKKVYFPGAGKQICLISKKIRPKSSKLHLGFIFSPPSSKEKLVVKSVRIFASKSII